MDRDARKVTHLSFTPTSVQPSVQTEVNGLTQASVSSMSITNSYTYDALGRLTSISDGRGNGSTTVYTSVGLVAYTEDTANNRTSYGYDIFGRRSSVTDALNNTGHFAYDTNDRILATWGSSYPVAYEYDSQGRQIAMATTRDENYRSTTADSASPQEKHFIPLLLPSSVDIPLAL
jgi:YD repeat-containing protein